MADEGARVRAGEAVEQAVRAWSLVSQGFVLHDQLCADGQWFHAEIVRHNTVMYLEAAMDAHRRAHVIMREMVDG